MDSNDAVHRSQLEEAYVRSAPSGIRLAYLLTGDLAVAEDLVQEAFLRFVGRLHFLRDPHAFDAYMRRTIVNLSNDLHRRRATERSYLKRHAEEGKAHGQDPDASTYLMIRAALLRLPNRQRAAIVLRYYEDLPEPQIADILRCRPATVRSLISRGLHVLRETPEVSR